MEPSILQLQARILCWTGLGIVILGLYLGIDPMVISVRAMAGAVIACIAGGFFLRLGAKTISDFLRAPPPPEPKPVATPKPAAPKRKT
jgi:hypothetical protein